MTEQNVRGNLIPAVKRVAERFKALELHAARGGREVMEALTETVRLSPADDLDALASDVKAAVWEILAVMPAYAPPLNAMHRVLSRIEQAEANDDSVDEVRAIIQHDLLEFRRWSEDARGRIAAIGASLIPADGTVFTFTLSETALRTLRFARESGKHFRVLVTESRPNQDGLRTARELAVCGVDVEMSIDACLADLMAKADVILIGAESIRADGSAIAKIGTYPAALLATQYGIPLYIMVDTLKFDVSSMLGLPMDLDQISTESVLPVDMSDRASVVGHLFDRTPSFLIRGIVTERGLISPQVCAALMRTMPVSQQLSNRLRN